MLIIGIDPGTATTGYGVIEIKSKQGRKKEELKFIAYGTIQTAPHQPAELRLKKIYNEVTRLIKKYKPNVLSIEKIFFFKNFKTVIPVSEVRGIILLAAAKKRITIKEFTPLQVKMGISGYGRADKRQVQRMVKKILGLKKIPKPDDAADALAIAVCATRENLKNWTVAGKMAKLPQKK